jgi:hypothetical protein
MAPFVQSLTCLNSVKVTRQQCTDSVLALTLSYLRVNLWDHIIICFHVINWNIKYGSVPHTHSWRGDGRHQDQSGHDNGMLPLKMKPQVCSSRHLNEWHALICWNINKITEILSVMAVTSWWEGTKLWLENFYGEMNQYTEIRGVMEKSDIQKYNKRITGTVGITTSTLTIPLLATKHCDEFKNTITRQTFIKLLDVLPSHDQSRYVCLVAFRLTRFYFTELGTSMFVWLTTHNTKNIWFLYQNTYKNLQPFSTTHVLLQLTVKIQSTVCE